MNILRTCNTLSHTYVFLCPYGRCHWHLAHILATLSHLEIQQTIPGHLYGSISQASVSLDLRTSSDQKSMSSLHVTSKSGVRGLSQKQSLTTEGQEFIPYFTNKSFFNNLFILYWGIAD